MKTLQARLDVTRIVLSAIDDGRGGGLGGTFPFYRNRIISLFVIAGTSFH